jgi:hypothetical protein
MLTCDRAGDAKSTSERSAERGAMADCVSSDGAYSSAKHWMVGMSSGFSHRYLRATTARLSIANGIVQNG